MFDLKIIYFCLLNISVFTIANNVSVALSPHLQKPLAIKNNFTKYPLKIKLKKFIFKGNTVFTTEQLKEAVALYEGREITFTELSQARDAITKLYNDNGYINSSAIIPISENQFLNLNEGATITIQIVEGQVEKINISGSTHIRDYVFVRLDASTSPVFNVNRLAKYLRFLQNDPLIKNISAQINPGSDSNKAVLDVKVEEKQPFRTEVGLNNERSPSVGSFQRQVQISDANLLGIGDKFSVGYRNTDGSNVIETSYALPVNINDGVVQFSFRKFNSSIIESPFSILDIFANSQSYEISFKQPVIKEINSESTKELTIGVSGTYNESKTFLLNQPFRLSVGADGEGRTKITAIRFFQEWLQRATQEVLFVRSQFSLGFGFLGSTINSSEPDSRFLSWRGQAYWLRKISKRTNLIVRADLQLADRPLVPLEQFGIGGALSVRGYRQDSIVADNGFFSTIEFPTTISAMNAGEIQLIPFVDFGTVWKNGGNNNLGNQLTNASTLASVGMGLSYRIQDDFSARFDFALPIINFQNSDSSNTWQEKGLYFSIRYGF